jgi:hypothetical protein
LPQAPQFELSLASVLHWPLQLVWPAEQPPLVPAVPEGSPLVGFAQPDTSKRQPNTAVRRAEKDRVFIDLPRR